MPFLTLKKKAVRKVAQGNSPRIRFKYLFKERDHPWLEGNGDSENVFVVEDPPREVGILYKTVDYAEHVYKSYRIRFKKPWSYMIIHFRLRSGDDPLFRGASIFFTQRKLKKDTDCVLRLVPLPNIGYRRSVYPGVCVGGAPVYTSRRQKSALEIQDGFWKSSFNNELVIPRESIPRGVRYPSHGSEELPLRMLRAVAKQSAVCTWRKAPPYISSLKRAIVYFSQEFDF